MKNNVTNEGAMPSDYSSFLDKMESKEKEASKAKNLKPIPDRAFRNTLHKRENYDNYLFSCHSFGRLMGGIPKPLSESQRLTYDSYHDRFMGIGRELTEKQEAAYFDLGKKLRAKVKLSDGAKTYLEELVREDVFGRRNTIETKYMDKGIQVEDESIALYGQFIGEDLHKNEDRVKNDFWQGECDNKQSKIRDFKNSWEYHTFPRTQTAIKNMLYEWQLQLYMDLYGFDEAELVYCLVDTPFRLVEDELRRMGWNYDILTLSCDDVKSSAIPLVVEKVSNMIYTWEGLQNLCDQSGILQIDWFYDSFIELPIEKRVKVFETTRNEKMIQQGKDMIVLAREFMNTIKEE